LAQKKFEKYFWHFLGVTPSRTRRQGHSTNLLRNGEGEHCATKLP
jgi:hypothetical protein